MNLDYQYSWKQAVDVATELGFEHAVLDRKTVTETELIKLITIRFGTFEYRIGHERELHRAYSASFNGITITRRAEARGSRNLKFSIDLI